MLLKYCRCGKLLPYGVTRCAECEEKYQQRQEENKAARDKKYNKKRDPKYRKFYSSKDWRTLSAVVLSKALYRCEDCGGLAVEVHHDPPIYTEEGWAGRLNISHCHALCTSCHNQRHSRFQKNKRF